MKVAVIGAGIFGCTAAIHLSRDGHQVHLFERGPSCMESATAINQFRLHKGYHYPRAPETVAECQRAEASFREEYPAAVIDGGMTYYAIASEGSKTSVEGYVRFCREHDFDIDPIQPANIFENGMVGLTVGASEARIDLDGLRYHVQIRLDGWGMQSDGRRHAPIHVHLNTSAHKQMREDFDKIVVCAYAQTNGVAKDLDFPTQDLQYEVVEKCIVKMPDEFENTGIVIMDGEFGCVDPLWRTGLHVLGHVKHAILHSNVGDEPQVPGEIAACLNAGMIAIPPATAYMSIRDSLAEYIPMVGGAKYVGSMYTTRVVLPNKDKTDERPTVVTEVDEQIITVLAGKLSSCVDAAKGVVRLCDEVRH